MNYVKVINDFIKDMRCESCKNDQIPIFKIDNNNNETINCCCQPFSLILVNRIKQMVAILHKITELNCQIDQAKESVHDWIDANASLARSAAEERAKNKSLGHGFLGLLMGSTYRSVMRSAAAHSNAALAADVAEKRALNAEGKRKAQQHVKYLQAELSAAKQELKLLKQSKRD